MYPKNAASPEPIAIGAVVQISDGAVQTSGCTVRIKPIGVAEGDGAGTTAYSTDGIVLYTPTQAETNYTSFILIAKKTGCIPVALTIVKTGDSFARIGALGAGLTSLASQTSVNALGSASAVTVERSVSDTNSITFAWPVSGATITGTRSIDNATYGAVAGAIAFLRTETGKHYYTLAHNAADRPTAEGQVRYAFVDGTYTRYVVLRVATAALDSADKDTLVDLIWDEPLTGATHNVATSSGKRLRQTTAFQQIDSTVIDASATTTTFITGLTPSVDDFYNDSMLVFTDGALAGQVRAIYDYIGASRTIILEEALTSVPVNGVAFAIVSFHIHPVSQIQAGLATAATALSTTQWTNTLATNLGTTNTTVATNLNATVSSRSTQTSVDTIDDLLDTEIPALTAAVAAEAVKTSAIKVKTDNLPTDPADQSLVEAAITAATSPLATPAQVNAEVVDVLSVDTFAELSAPPAATSSLKDKLTWLFMYARNKVTQTATTRTLYRDDTTTVAGTSGTSDNGTTFTKGEDA